MSFSDEPTVVAQPARRRWLWLAVPAVALFLAVVFSANFERDYQQWKRATSERGPAGGTVHAIRLEGSRRILELARGADHNPAFRIDPLPDDPASVSFRYTLPRVNEPQFRGPHLLQFDAPSGAWTTTGQPWHPRADIRVEIEILRGTRVVWSGSRWSYGPESDLEVAPQGGHDHHGHSH